MAGGDGTAKHTMKSHQRVFIKLKMLMSFVLAITLRGFSSETRVPTDKEVVMFMWPNPGSDMNSSIERMINPSTIRR